MKDDVIIRTDGGKEIGFGHLVRCLALAQMLKKNFNITFICKDIPENIKNEILDKKFILKEIESEDAFFQYLTPEMIVVIDGYHFDTDYECGIKKIGCKLVTIDDLYNREFFADLIINHSQGVDKKDYNAQKYTKFALGLEYALMRPSFLEQAKQNLDVHAIETAFICCGGSDPENFTERILEVTMEYSELKKILVITGNGYSQTEKIQQLSASDHRVEHYNAVDENEMYNLMVKADLAIVPTSSILLEAMCCSCKILCFWYVRDQETFHNYIVENNFVKSFGDNSLEFKREKLQNTLKQMIQNPSDQNYEVLMLKLANVENNLNEKFKSLV